MAGTSDQREGTVVPSLFACESWEEDCSCPSRKKNSILWNSSLKTGSPVGVEFACRHRSVRSGFHQPTYPCCRLLFCWPTRSLRIYLPPFLKTGSSVKVEFGYRHRSARFDFLRPRCLCYLALFRSAYSGSFRFCSHHSSLKRGYSVEVEFECRRRSARSGFHRRIVPRPAQNSLPSRPLLETPIRFVFVS